MIQHLSPKLSNLLIHQSEMFSNIRSIIFVFEVMDWSQPKVVLKPGPRSESPRREVHRFHSDTPVAQLQSPKSGAKGEGKDGKGRKTFKKEEEAVWQRKGQEG